MIQVYTGNGKGKTTAALGLVPFELDIANNRYAKDSISKTPIE